MTIPSHHGVAERFSATLRRLTEARPENWQFLDWSQGVLSWRSFRPPDAPVPAQGWKIHVSAAAVEATALCDAVAPVLFALGAAFKVPQRVDDIVVINSGDAGPMQVGKIITIYPQDDAHAAEIARRVDAVWPVSRGPEVRTDLHVRPGSAVSMRYGVFGQAPTITSSTGQQEFALRTAAGVLVPDTRCLQGEQPSHLPAPPVPCCPPRPEPVRLNETIAIDGLRCVPLTVLSDKPKAKIFIGLDLRTLTTVIIKVGRPGVGGDERGLDVGDMLRKEFRILTALSAHQGLAPVALAWADGEWPISVLEDFRGDLLSELGRDDQVGCLVPLANAVARLHQAGYVHGDVKLENAVRRGAGVGLIDFELAESEGNVTSPGGTRGHVAPEVRAGALAACSRDVFALGGCVANALLGIPPGLIPHGIERLRGLLSLEGFPEASRLLGILSHPDPDRRPSAAAAATAIAERLHGLRPGVASPRKATPAAERRWCWRAAHEAASLVERYARSGAEGHCWRNEHFMSAFDCEGINLGAAGIVLGLMTIDQAAGRPDFRAQTDAGARWLAARPHERQAAGLFTGNAGVGVALAVAGRRLRCDRYLGAGLQRIRAAADDRREIDLFAGMAGVLWAICLVRESLADDSLLDGAAAIVEVLHRHARRTDDIPVWTIDSAADVEYLGCAHGSAGIAMALGCWARQTGDRDAERLALETFHQLYARGRNAAGSAMRMTPKSDRSHAVGNWCHGVAGYLWCMLQAFGDHEALRTEIDWAVSILRRSPAAATPTYCHGLAGRLEIWRMIGAIPRFANVAAPQALKTARALRLVHSKRERKIVWCSDDPDITTPDLWVGFLGPATAVALYAAGVRAPLLSGEWLASCASGPRDAARQDYTI